MTPTFSIGDRIACKCRYCRDGFGLEGVIQRVDNCYTVVMDHGGKTEILFGYAELVSRGDREVLFHV